MLYSAFAFSQHYDEQVIPAGQKKNRNTPQDMLDARTVSRREDK